MLNTFKTRKSMVAFSLTSQYNYAFGKQPCFKQHIIITLLLRFPIPYSSLIQTSEAIKISSFGCNLGKLRPDHYKRFSLKYVS